MSLQLFILCVVAGLVGAVVEWGLERIGAPAFIARWASLTAALLVFATSSVLGIQL